MAIDSPLDLSLDRVSEAAEDLRIALGAENVHFDGPVLERAALATVPNARRPVAVVFPGRTAELQAVMRIAQRHRVPVWPVSSGRNWGYGSGTPVHHGAIVINLSRLNRIIEVNAELAYAVVEPGVTYRALRAHLEQHHPELWCDCTDGPPDGSVIGNALDRGIGVTHYADHFATLCGLEVVLPDGSLVRTGGGPSDCETWHLHKWGVGAYTEGLFSQSNMGVVTRAGVWLMPKPEAFVSFTFDLADPSKLPMLIDTVRDLALRGVLSSAGHVINDIVTLSVLTQYPAHLIDGHSRLPDALRTELCDRYRVPSWSFGGGLQGSRVQVRAARAGMRAALAPLGKLEFIDDRKVSLVRALLRIADMPRWQNVAAWLAKAVTGRSIEIIAAAPHIHSVLQGRPSDYFVRHAYFKSRVPKPDRADPDRDRCGLIWFAPVVPMTGTHVRKVLDLTAPLFVQYGFDHYAALLIQNPRAMIVLMSIFF
ncbi:MAG: FAD-dependent oxidoreductase, partial [Burkholderiales bacterium]